MSGKSYESYDRSYKSARSDFETDKELYYTKRKSTIDSARSEVHTKSAEPREKRTTEDLYHVELLNFIKKEEEKKNVANINGRSLQKSRV